jgi:hypothetical protein
MTMRRVLAPVEEVVHRAGVLDVPAMRYQANILEALLHVALSTEAAVLVGHRPVARERR